MVRGIDADHVQQISWAHRPAKLFLHHFVDFAEIRPVAQQLAKSGEVGEQHAVDEETGTIIDHDWRLAHFAGPGHHFGNGLIRGFFAANHFNQRHAMHRVKEVHAAEVLRALQNAGQLADGDR
ncbi:hypothetical protein SB00610_05218 [Klebsiella quasipneumoniae subsp. similipneumoniae]|nr:hypothetical protein SB00610_05218 [Klebsiella quasipneumoniae subsp. similipneumoniae]